MLDDGYGVVLDMHVYDAEYPHPVYWYDNNIVNRIFDNVRAERVHGHRLSGRCAARIRPTTPCGG